MLDDTRVINGSFGECHSEGKWLTNIYKMSADVEPSYGDVKMSGTAFERKGYRQHFRL